eukprot:CAMPEP_0181323994 /NCGR_PEP_ID=MMETSP1101-20121128/20102_1 /TAXON_ID=46948 /ORGANISM="Rhodomonas abbreviata, Strain Caron Lab Isolate" /LENGTH=130 /DNA_ID=CAMNT_0023432099 /DNA_START=21 /DNA_END=410 /DNA_ORIENTATION=+
MEHVWTLASRFFSHTLKATSATAPPGPKGHPKSTRHHSSTNGHRLQPPTTVTATATDAARLCTCSTSLGAESQSHVTRVLARWALSSRELHVYGVTSKISNEAGSQGSGSANWMPRGVLNSLIALVSIFP